MNRRAPTLSIFVIVYLMMSHVQLSAFTIESKSDARASDLTNNSDIALKAGVATEVADDSPLLLRSAGRVPVLIVPLKAQKSVVRIDSPVVGQVLTEERDLKIDEALSEVTLYLSEIHRAMGVRDLTRARQKLNEVKAKHPNVQFFNFIEASLAFLAGDRDQALSLVNAGLASHPDYSPGVELRKQLLQGSRP